MLIPVILSGGAGLALVAGLARSVSPKPFIRLARRQDAAAEDDRASRRLEEVELIITVTNREHYFLTKDEYREEHGRADEQLFLLEPCGRNTAPAVAMAAFHAVAACGDDTQLLILPADHLIEDQDALPGCRTRRGTLAKNGTLVTFGIDPTRPETGYGYIECGGPLDSPGAYRVSQFVEKPCLERAEEFRSFGPFLEFRACSASGLELFSSAARLRARRCTTGAEAVGRRRNGAAAKRSTWTRRDSRRSRTCPSTMRSWRNHADVAVVRAAFRWNDIGSWTPSASSPRPTRTATEFAVKPIMVDTRDCYIQSDSRVVAAVGVRDLIVVDTPDALLMTRQESGAGSEKVVSQLKLGTTPLHQFHRTVHRPWGTYHRSGGRAKPQDQAYRREAEGCSESADAPSSQRALGGGSGPAEVVNGQQAVRCGRKRVDFHSGRPQASPRKLRQRGPGDHRSADRQLPRGRRYRPFRRRLWQGLTFKSRKGGARRRGRSRRGGNYLFLSRAIGRFGVIRIVLVVAAGVCAVVTLGPLEIELVQRDAEELRINLLQRADAASHQGIWRAVGFHDEKHAGRHFRQHERVAHEMHRRRIDHENVARAGKRFDELLEAM